MRNRRQFIKNISLLSTSSLCLSMTTWSALTVLPGCSTMDEYLITDPSDLTDHVIIVGGGMTGLYAAYQLKKRKIPYRIFEGSYRLGGQILSDQNFEYGAFEFSNSDHNLLALVKDLNLKIEKIDSKSWIFKNGTANFLAHLVDRIGGVLPHQQIKLNHRLIAIDQNSQPLKLTFATQKSDKTYTTKKVLLALPANPLLGIKGLDLEFIQPIERSGHVSTEQITERPTEQLSEQPLKYKKYVRVILSHQKLGLKINTNKYKSFFKAGLNCEIRQIKDLTYITISGDEGLPNFPQEIEHISFWVAENIFDVPAASLNIHPENIYVWTSLSLVQNIKKLNSNVVVISEGYTVTPHRVENLLRAVNEKIDEFL